MADNMIFGKVYKLTIGVSNKESFDNFFKTSYSWLATGGKTTIDYDILNYVNLTTTEDRKESPDQIARIVRTTTRPYKAVIVNDLQMTATIETFKRGSMGETITKIDVYNFADEVLGKLKAGYVIQLEAGYSRTFGDNLNGDIGTIFTGTIVRVETVQKGDNNVTTFYCSETAFIKNNSDISYTASKGETFRSVVNKLSNVLKETGLSFDGIQPPSTEIGKRLEGLLDQSLPNGYTVEGAAYPKLKELCSNVGYRCYVSLGKLIIQPAGGTITGRSVVVTDEQVKGVLAPFFESAATSIPDPANNVEGVKFTTFLNYSINADSIIEVRSEKKPNFNGLYAVYSLKHALDYYGSAWDTHLECIPIK